MIKRFFYGGSWVLGGQVLGSLSGVVLNGLIARLLVPEEVGAYFLTFSLVSVAALLVQLGLNQTIVRLIAESMGTGDPNRAKSVVVKSFFLCALASLLMFFGFVIGGGEWIARNVFNSSIMERIIWLGGLWVAVIAFQNLFAESFRGFHDIRLASIFGGLLTSIISSLLFALIWIFQGHSNLTQIVIFSISAGIMSTIVSGFLLQKKLSGFENGKNLRFSEIFNIAGSLLVANLAAFILTQADIWILGSFRSQEEVAIYGAASRLVIFVTMPLMVINSVISPIISEMFSQEKKIELEVLLRTTATIAGIPALGGFLICLFFGASVLEFVYGPFYREGTIILILLALGRLGNVLVGSCGLTLIMTGHQATLMGITLVSGAIAVGGAFLLVGPYGAVGVSGIVSLTMLLRNIFMLYFARKKSGVWTHVRFSIFRFNQIFSR